MNKESSGSPSGKPSSSLIAGSFTRSITSGTLSPVNAKRIGGITGAAALIFSYLLVISVSLGLPKQALAPPLTFDIFFWIFFCELAGFIVFYLLWIRLIEGAWGLFPGSAAIFQALGAGGTKFIRLFMYWNGFCFLWIFMNLYFLYSGTPLIDNNTYGMGLGVMVTGNAIIGLFLGLSEYGKD
jgi:hypothetical protein